METLKVTCIHRSPKEYILVVFYQSENEPDVLLQLIIHPEI